MEQKQEQDEQEEEVPGFYDRPDSTIDSWRYKPAALRLPAGEAAATAVATSSPPWPEDIFDPHYDSFWKWYEQEGGDGPAPGGDYAGEGGFCR